MQGTSKPRLCLLMQGTKSLTFSMLDWGCQIFHGTRECQKELFIKSSDTIQSPGGGGVLGSIFAGYVPLAYPDPYPIIVYSVANYRPHVSHFWANIPQISTCRNLLTPEIPQMCDPILVTLLAPNENATPL